MPPFGSKQTTLLAVASDHSPSHSTRAQTPSSASRRTSGQVRICAACQPSAPGARLSSIRAKCRRSDSAVKAGGGGSRGMESSGSPHPARPMSTTGRPQIECHAASCSRRAAAVPASAAAPSGGGGCATGDRSHGWRRSTRRATGRDARRHVSQQSGPPAPGRPSPNPGVRRPYRRRAYRSRDGRRGSPVRPGPLGHGGTRRRATGLLQDAGRPVTGEPPCVERAQLRERRASMAAHAGVARSSVDVVGTAGMSRTINHCPHALGHRAPTQRRPTRAAHTPGE